MIDSDSIDVDISNTHFRSCKLNFEQSDLNKVIECCKLSCNIEPVATNADYSTGSTYFIRADETPRCVLEECAKSIFEYHTQGVRFDATNSGAEWWTQVIDSRDDIGFHWDKDYGAEEVTGEIWYPNLCTVTYFSFDGAPTVILNRGGPPCKEHTPYKVIVTYNKTVLHLWLNANTTFRGL